MSPEQQPIPLERENIGILAVAIGASVFLTPIVAGSLIVAERLEGTREFASELWGQAKHAGKKVVNALEDPTKHAAKRVVAGIEGAVEEITDLGTVAWPTHPLRRLRTLAHNLVDRFEEK